MDRVGLPVGDLIEGAESKPEISGDVAELEALLAGDGLAAEAVEPAPEVEKFVYDHNDVRKEFDTREELLGYESGQKSNEIGDLRQKLAELKAKSDAYEAMAPGKESAPQVTAEEQQKRLMSAMMDGTGIDLSKVDDPASFQLIAKMIENSLNLYHDSVATPELGKVRTRVDEITTRTQEAEALHAAGIQVTDVQKILEKHPLLAGLPPSKERVAVIASLVSGQGKEPTNDLRNALQPSVADHVEGSAVNESTLSGEQALMKKASEMSDKDLLTYLGNQTAKGSMPWEQ